MILVKIFVLKSPSSLSMVNFFFFRNFPWHSSINKEQQGFNLSLDEFIFKEFYLLSRPLISH